jgi:ceramide glucosyltransferase
VILNGILGTLAVVSFFITLWQWLVARRFPLHQRSADLQVGAGRANPNAPNGNSALQPAVTLLKPLKGCDAHTEECLRSWLAQDYAGGIQALFAIGSADDPAGAVVKKLLAEFPARDAQLVVCPERLGANAKVSKLAQLEPHAKHEVLLISDSDVRVPPDLLANVVAPLGDGTVGLVSCLYQLANPTTLAMRCEAIAVNADFWSQVLQGASMRKVDFALGAVMATRRKQLAEIGGFRALAGALADDYQLGHRLARRGYRIELSPIVVECWSPPMNWRAVWRHQLRWARTIRVCQPWPYFFSIVANATLWPLLWLAVRPGLVVVAPVLVFLATRIISALCLRKWLTRSCPGSDGWLVPVKDLLHAVIWVCAFAGNRIEWRGERYRLRRDGTLIKE